MIQCWLGLVIEAMDGYPFAQILHPIGRVREHELEERAEAAFPQVKRILEMA